MENLFSNLRMNEEGIYSYEFDVGDQAEELLLRQEIANISKDYLNIISRSHSIPVMDREVRLFLDYLPLNAIILDVGGGWGWHFRNLSMLRPDITLIILDAVIENLQIAQKLISVENKKVFFVHGTATTLPFAPETFDGYWSVQALQHVPNFSSAIAEAYKVIKPGGYFVNYSLQDQQWVNLLYRLFSRNPTKRRSRTSFYLNKASAAQFSLINKVFCGGATIRYTEFIFNPSLKISFPGKAKSIFGKLDSYISNSNSLLGTLARQQSIHVKKKNGKN